MVLQQGTPWLQVIIVMNETLKRYISNDDNTNSWMLLLLLQVVPFLEALLINFQVYKTLYTMFVKLPCSQMYHLERKKTK